MDRKELVLKKLANISDEEMEIAIKQLTHHVNARLRINSINDRTKSGAHSEPILGVDPVMYYVNESLKRIYDPNGWDWKFEERTLTEQLCRIANKLISDQVKRYKKRKESDPEFISADVSEVWDLSDPSVPQDEHLENGEMSDKVKELAFKLSEDNENLFFFTELYFEDKSHKEIAEELGISINDVYVLQKKLVRRLMKHKEDLQ